MRDYQTEEAGASTARLETLINAFLSRCNKSEVKLRADLTIRKEPGFTRASSGAKVWEINPGVLDRDAFLNEIADDVGLHAETLRSEDWAPLRDQIWFDAKLELAVRDVPWIQETDIRITDLYDPKVRLLVGLGDVRGSASYQSFYVNFYRNRELSEVQAIFNTAGYRLIPIPVQMEEKDLSKMGRVLNTILGDNRIIRMAFTKPTKEAAVKTGLFNVIDPDTLDTGVVNTAAIEREGSERHFVRRTTDGLGTIAKAKESLAKTGRTLGNSITGIIGLRGFGSAVLGKLLTDLEAPNEVRIAVRDASYQHAVEVIDWIKKAYEKKTGKPTQTIIRILKYSEFDFEHESHPLKQVDVLFDCTKVGMNDDHYSLRYLGFITPTMIVFHAAYRDKDKQPRVPPILCKARAFGAVVHNGIADWLGHQYMQVTEDLKRASGLMPDMPEWNDDKWVTIRNQLENVAFKWANLQGLKDAMDLLGESGVEGPKADGHE